MLQRYFTRKYFSIINILKLHIIFTIYHLLGERGSLTRAKRELKDWYTVQIRAKSDMVSFFNSNVFCPLSTYFRSNKVWKMEDLWYASIAVFHPLEFLEYKRFRKNWTCSICSQMYSLIKCRSKCWQTQAAFWIFDVS